MSTSGQWNLSANSSASSRALQDDIRLELECHLELAVDELVASGNTPECARAEALRRFGDIDSIAGRCLGEKRKGELAMKGLVALLVASLILVTSALVYTTFEQRRHAERQMVLAMDAARAAKERLDLPPILIGENDRAAVGDLVRIAPPSEHVELQVSVRVDSGGMILLPEIGRISVTDMSRAEIEAWVNDEYAKFYADLAPIYVIIERTPPF